MAMAFKTLAGAQKRCAFENAHSKFKYRVVRCYGGVPDKEPFDKTKVYTYRVERVKV